MAGAVACEWPSAWHIHTKSILDQVGVCRMQEAFKILRLTNLSVEAFLQTNLQGLTTRLKNEAWKVDVLQYEGFKTRDGFEREDDYVAQKRQTVQCSSQYNRG
jgi:hypothetical protein